MLVFVVMDVDGHGGRLGLLFLEERPPAPEPDELSLGEWAHGWQYHASNTLENAVFALATAEEKCAGKREDESVILLRAVSADMACHLPHHSSTYFPRL